MGLELKVTEPKVGNSQSSNFSFSTYSIKIMQADHRHMIKSMKYGLYNEFVYAVLLVVKF